MSAQSVSARRLLLSRVTASFGETADVLGKIKAIVGPPDLKAFGPLAEQARQKLRDDPEATLNDDEEQAIELALRMTRPAPLVVDGALGALDKDFGGAAFPTWGAFRDTIKPRLRSIGRLDGAAGNRHVGTGFLVAPHLVLTNAHVLSQLSYGTDRLKDGQAVIRFKLEDGADGPMEAVPIRRAIGRHPRADLALLVIDPLADLPLLAFSDAPASAGDAVAVVGFPGADMDRNPFFVPLLLPGALGLKRAAPGVVLETDAVGLIHDASTLGGNSGSPVISMATGKVVAVHNAGAFMWQNGAVPADVAAAFVKAQGV